jgi:hypothetical protein
MSDRESAPDVEAIIGEIRQGMDDVEPATSADPDLAARHDLRASVRVASATRDVLGLCNSGVRGRLCRLFAKLLLPMVQQLNAHHGAVAAALRRLAEGTRDGEAPDVEARLARLEADVAALKKREQA